MQEVNVIHSGGVGDLLYSLPTCASFKTVNFYLNPSKFMSKDAAIAIIPLLRIQPYIKTAELYNKQRFDCDLDLFREQGGLRTAPLSIVSLCIFQRYYNVANPWIFNVEPNPVSSIIINRTERYPGYIDYVRLLNKYGDQCLFVGLAQEHSLFEKLYGKIKYHRTSDFLEVAQLIKGAKFFIGNQSAAFAIAEGMKTPRIVEVCQDAPNCTPIGQHGHSSWEYLDIIQLVERYL